MPIRYSLPAMQCTSSLIMSIALATFASHAYASPGTCAANTDPNTWCNDLLIHLPSTSINIDSTVEINTSSSQAIWNANGATATSIINNGVIQGGPHAGIYNGSGGQPSNSMPTITTLTNHHQIGGNPGILNEGYIGTLNNFGYITSLRNSQQIGSITNGKAGVDSSYVFLELIFNDGSIDTINNVQGRYVPPLTLLGNLPSHYNIIINSPTDYGSLEAYQVGNSQTTFGIVNGSTVQAMRYVNVLNGVELHNLTNTSGVYLGFDWTLQLQNASNSQWDLLFDPTPVQNIQRFQSVAGQVDNGAAKVLDQLMLGTPGAQMTQAIVALQNMDKPQQAATLRHIAPETSRSNEAASRATMGSGLDTVSARIDSVRGQGYQASLADELKSGRVMLAAVGDANDYVASTPAKNHSLWMKAFGANGNQDHKSGYAGYDSRTWGTSLGADTMLESGTLVGAALTYAHTDVDLSGFRQGDGSDIKTYQLTGYASRDFGNWYLDGMLAYARQHFDSRRDSGLTGLARADFSGDQLASRITAGKPVSLNSVTTLTPTLGLEWNHLKQDGYQESGAGALSLDVSGQSANRLRSVVGMILSTQRLLANGITVTPSLRTSWRHDFRHEGIDTTATFSGGGSAFHTPGQDLARDSYSLGATLALQRSRDFVISALVDSEQAAGYRAISAQLMARWMF